MGKDIYTVAEIKDIITPIAKAHGVKSVSLFGSYAHGSANQKSDIDLLIDGGKINSLWTLSGFRLDVCDALQKEIDIVTKTASDHAFVESISKDGIMIYAEP